MTSTGFEDRILNGLLPTFCNDPSRRWGCDGFRKEWHKISGIDAQDFLRGLDAGLVEHVGRGMYRAPRSHASEQFFWSGLRDIHPRPVTLSIEPIITVAVLSRLHFDRGWPKDYLGTQSKEWAFDVAAYLPSNPTREYVACEVKKTERELEQLIALMRRFGESEPIGDLRKEELNAFRKVKGLRSRRAPLFWAVGPGGINAVFRVIYSDGDLVTFEEAPLAELQYPTP